MSHFFSQNHKKHLQIFQNSYSYPLFEKKHANPNGVIVLVDIENVHKPLKERENTLYPADFKKSLDEELKRDNPRSYISDIIAFGRKDILTQADVYNFDQQDIIFHDVPWRPSYCPSHLQGTFYFIFYFLIFFFVWKILLTKSLFFVCLF